MSFLYTLNLNQKAVIENGWAGKIKLNHLAVFESIKNMVLDWQRINKLQDEKGDWYNISYQKIIDELPILDVTSKSTIAKIVQVLEELELIETNPKNKELNRTYMRLGSQARQLIYWEPCEKIPNPLRKNSEGPCEKIRSNEITNNHITNNEYLKKTSNKFDADDYIQNLDIDKDLKQAFFGLLEIRKIKKTATSQNSIDLIMKNLRKWYPNQIDKQIQSIENSVQNGWTGVFEIKTTQNYSQKPAKTSQNQTLGANSRIPEKQPKSDPTKPFEHNTGFTVIKY